MRKILSFFAAMLFAGSMMATTVEVVIAGTDDCYATTHSWVQGSTTGAPAYDQVVLDDNITANLIGTGNNGKFYSDWRFYNNGSENGSFSIDAAEGCELSSVTITFTTSNSGALFHGENKLNSDEAYAVSGSQVVFRCKNTNDATNGQVRVTKIAVSYEGGSSVVYTVAGSSEIAFGTAWDPANTANKMKKQADGSYKWEKEGLELPAGDILFKVCQDLAWTQCWPEQNYSLPIAKAGIYTISITFEPANENKVSAEATKTGDAVVIPTVAMHGNFLGSWADTENFALAEDKQSASLSLTLEPGDFEFGMRIGGTGNWTANGVAFTRDNASAEVVAGSDNLTLAADIAGEYVFTWTFETNTLAIKFPKKAAVLPQGAYRLTFTYFDKADGDGSAKLNTVEAIFDEASQPRVSEVLVGSDVYAGRYYEEDGERINSNLKLGTSGRAGELKFTLKEEVEVDSIVFRAAMYGNSEGGDGFSVNGEAFTLSAGKLIFEDKVWKPEGKVSEIDIVQTKAEKGRFFLTSITVFAKQGSVEPPVEEPTFTVAGNLENLFGTEWDPANAENDMNLLEDGYYTWLREGVALTAGTEILFKVCKNHSWDVAYPAENYKLEIPADGVYSITIGFNPVTLVVDGSYKLEGEVPPVTDKVEIRLVPGEWNANGAKFAAATLNEVISGKPTLDMLTSADFSDWFVEEGEGVFVGMIPATAKMIAFGRFPASTETPSIAAAMLEMLNQTDVLVIDPSMKYIIDGITGDDPSFSPGHWDAEVPPVETKELHLVPGPWAEADPIIAAWAWAEGAEGDWYLFERAEDGNLVANIPANASKVIFLRFPAGTIPSWEVEAWDKTDDLDINDCLIFYVNDWNNYSWCEPQETFLPPTDWGDEIIFYKKDVAAAGQTAKSFVCPTNAEFVLSVVDDNGKIAIDANEAKFGEVENFFEYKYRLKTGGKSTSKNALSLAIPADGQLRVGVRTGSNSATDRTLVLKQNDVELYNAVVQEADAAQYEDGINEETGEPIIKKVYPYIIVPVKAGIVTIEYPVNGLNFYEFGFKKGEVPPVVEHTYTVAGDNPVVFGTSWEPSNAENDMTLSGDNLYTWIRTGLELPVCSLEFKVVEDHSWDVAYPANNMVINIPAEGTYTITISFNAETKEVGFEVVREDAPQPGEMVNIRLVPGDWDADGAKFAAVTLAEIPTAAGAAALANAVISDWFVADPDLEGAFVGQIPAETKVIAFGRVNPEVQELTPLDLLNKEIVWNHSDILIIDPSMKYTIDGWEEEGKDFCPGHWGDLPPVVEHTYTFVGPLSPAGWDPSNEAGLMTPEDDIYSFYLENVELAAGTYEYKIAEDGSWAVSYPQQGNATFTIEEPGKYNVYFWINAESKEYGAIPELVEAGEVTPVVELAGAFNGWAGEEFTKADDKKSASITKTLDADDHEFKIIIAGGWLGDGQIFAREDNSKEVTVNGGNMILKADVAGEYIFTWNYEAKALTITFPDNTQGIEEIIATGKVVKVIRNGQVFILKGDKIFNTTGIQVR